MVRNSNIELLRLIAMLLVVLLHTNYFSLGVVESVDFQTAPYHSFFKVFFEQACIICVNVFVLISGWFGIKPTLKGASSLLFQVFFYHIIIISSAIWMGINVPTWMIIEPFYLGHPYWFVQSYLILYVTSPILNIFIEKATRKMYFAVLISYFILEFSTSWICSDYKNGYSFTSFIGLYLLARFIRIYPIKITQKKASFDVCLYLLMTLIPILLFYITKRSLNMISYASPFVVLASLFFFLAFSKLKFQSKFINYLACSSFSIYLVHQHPFIKPYFVALMNNMYNYLGGALYIVFVVLFAVIFGLGCIMVDKIRIVTWNFLYHRVFNKLFSTIERWYDKVYLSL